MVNLARSILETIALFLLCVLSFLIVFFVLPYLNPYSFDDWFMAIWNLLWANIAFFGLPYLHLTDLKGEGFLPNASSYALILLLAILGVLGLLSTMSQDLEWWETLYAFAQACLSCYVAYLAVEYRRGDLSE